MALLGPKVRGRVCRDVEKGSAAASVCYVVGDSRRVVVWPCWYPYTKVGRGQRATVRGCRRLPGSCNQPSLQSPLCPALPSRAHLPLPSYPPQVKEGGDFSLSVDSGDQVLIELID